MGNRKNNNRKHATVKRSRKKMKAVKKGYTASQPPRVALGSLPERPEDWSQMLRIICRDIVLDPCANVGDYRNVGQQFSFQVRTAGGDAVECTAKTRHPNTDRRVKRPAATEEHCDHLQPLMVELSPSELAADLVLVRCWSDQQRTGEPLSTTLFIKQDERLRLLVENATMRARIIRTAGCSGDWRLDECCGNEYIPAGIGAMATDKSCMFQEPAGHQPAYTFPGDAKAMTVPYERVTASNEAEGATAEDAARRERTRGWFHDAAAPLLGELATVMEQAEEGRCILDAMDAEVGLDDECIDDTFLWPSSECQRRQGARRRMSRSQWGLRSACVPARKRPPQQPIHAATPHPRASPQSLTPARRASLHPFARQLLEASPSGCRSRLQITSRARCTWIGPTAGQA